MLGVVQRDDAGSVVRVAHGPNEQRDADRRSRDNAKRLVDIERRLADADLTDPRWHASTLVRISLGLAARASRCAASEEASDSPNRAPPLRAILIESRTTEEERAEAFFP